MIFMIFQQFYERVFQFKCDKIKADKEKVQKESASEE